MADVGETGKSMEQMIQKLTKAVEKTQGSHMISVDASVFGVPASEDGTEKKVTIFLEPERFKPVSASLYKKAVNEILGSDGKLGFIIMDGITTLFGTLSGWGKTREVLHEFEANIVVKGGRGRKSALDKGPSKLRRLQNYIQKTSELGVQYFVEPMTEEPNVEGLILAATVPFMTYICRDNMFNPCLRAKIVNAVDISYGGEKAFNEVIAEILRFQPFAFVRCSNN